MNLSRRITVNFKKHTPLLALLASAISPSAFARNAGNWNDTFHPTPKLTITHTPDLVIVTDAEDGSMMSGK